VLGPASATSAEFRNEAGALPVAALSWSVPPRFGPAQFVGSPAKPIIATPNSWEYAHPAVFTVILDACASKAFARTAEGAPARIATYQWQGVVAPPPRKVVRPQGGRRPRETDDSTDDNEGPAVTYVYPCRFSISVPTGSSVTVGLTVTDSLGNVSSPVSQVVAPRDFLIASLGDSFASGEGNPDIPQKFNWLGYVEAGAQWADRRCHRSSNNAGPARAALAVENRDPHTTVTVIQLACSGAKISAGLLQPYAGVDPIRTDDEKSALCPPVQPDPSCIPPQIDQLGAIVGDRKIDALLISIGGNDMGFGTVASECAMPFNDCRDAMLPVVDEGLQLAQIRFDDLAKAIEAKLPVESHSVYLTEYPDPTVNAQGRYARPPGLLNGLLVREARWASEYVIAKLNETVRGAADEHGWTFVDGVGPQFRGPGYGHGLAAGSERWFNTLEDSFVLQGPVPRLCPLKVETLAAEAVIGAFKGAFLSAYAAVCGISNLWAAKSGVGILHPNERGHRAYADAILEKLVLP